METNRKAALGIKIVRNAREGICAAAGEDIFFEPTNDLPKKEKTPLKQPSWIDFGGWVLRHVRFDLTMIKLIWRW